MPGADMNVVSRFLDIILKNLETTFVLVSLGLVTPPPPKKATVC